MILSDALISPVSQLQTHQVIVFLYSFSSRNRWKSSHNGGFKYDLMMISDSGLLFGPPGIYDLERTVAPRHVRIIAAGFSKPSEDAPLPAFFP